MVDIHTHILPKLDDGSRDTEESLRMLRASAEQDVRVMVATPHFYATENTPERFLRRRAASAEALRRVWKPGMPQVVLGAEVRYFDGVSRTERLDALKLGATAFLLLEMPFCPWTSRMVSEVLELQDRQDTQVLLAHIERYLAHQPKSVWDALYASGVKMQCNASFFLHWRTKRKALRMLRERKIHFVASDCHNMAARPPRLGEAMKMIESAPSGKSFLCEEAAAFLRMARKAAP